MAARVHDLACLASATRVPVEPAWARAALLRTPWVVVRRTPFSDAECVPVGIRGSSRCERLAATVPSCDIARVRRPEDLVSDACASAGRLGETARRIERAASARGLAWGPTGSFGFELASGATATHAASDLDLVVRAARASHASLVAFARDCARIASDTRSRIDAEVDFDSVGIALAEFAGDADAFAAKTPNGPALLARAATLALLDELATTPKPGLVDLEHRGAHRDLCLDRLHDSALALEPAFAAIATAAAGNAPSRALREEIGALARAGERKMLAASGGSNTHRGALWALGLLVAAAASLPRAGATAVAVRAGGFARIADRFGGAPGSHGALVARRYGANGARGEAAAGFPNVVGLALPLLRARAARADVLLALLARVDDTCILHRGGRAALALARHGARAALRAGGTTTRGGLAATRRLDSALVARNASPGGCADLLAAAMFLDAVGG